jgi:hypothetical protein
VSNPPPPGEGDHPQDGGEAPAATHDLTDHLPLGEVAAAPGSSSRQAVAQESAAEVEGAEPPVLSAEHEPSSYDHAAPADILNIIAQVQASADDEERTAARLDRETIGYVWPVALIPLGLVLVMLNALLGDWVWILLPASFLAIVAALLLMPLRHRYANERPLELPDATRLHGQRKRRFLLKLTLIAAALFVGEMLFRMYGAKLWDWRVPWGW